jgi:hypothetical protein
VFSILGGFGCSDIVLPIVLVLWALYLSILP